MSTDERMKKRGIASVGRIVLYITCICGRIFASEDLEPECPYCGRRYEARIEGDPSGFKVSLRLIGGEESVELGSEEIDRRFKPRTDLIET
ncbi:MAG: hypothetical protein QXE01_00850 [Sulfolobales archaeon]